MGVAILLRHGTSTANVAGLLAGRTPGIPLHDTGRTEAASLASAFATAHITSVHVSPLERTRETAALALPHHVHTIADALVELDYGIFTGQPFSEVEGHEAWRDMRRDPAAFTFPGGEAIADVAMRVIKYISEASRAPGLHVFVTHADNILLIANHAAGASLREYQRLHVDPASITVVVNEAESLHLVALNVPASGAEALLARLAR